MNNINKKLILKKYNIKAISTILIVTVILFSSSIVLYQGVINSIEKAKSKSELTLKNIQYDELSIYLDSLQASASIQANVTANDIKNDINKQYADLSILETELNNNIYSDDLINIFENNIKNKYLNDFQNFHNDMYVANFTGIISDYSYEGIRNGKIRRSWKEESKNQYNKELYKESLSNLLNQNRDFIVQEKNHLCIENKKHDTITTFNKDVMKDIFYKYGIEGFKNYTFLAPAYIYNHEDMFGNNDIINGIKTNNNKIMVIQEFSLYDQVEKNYPDIFFSNDLENNMEHYEQVLNTLYGLGILLVISISGLIFFLCTLYNWIMVIIRKSEEDKNK